jgi:hypothetical protein
MISPEEQKEIITLYMAGYTHAVIASKLGISTKTVQRTLRRFNIRRGELNEHLVEESKKDLLNFAQDHEGLQRIIASVHMDLLAQIKKSRDISSNALDQLENLSNTDPAITMRALAAHSVAIKNHAESIKKFIPDPNTSDPNQLPELIVRELTDFEVQQLRMEQEEEERMLSGKRSLLEKDHTDTESHSCGTELYEEL